MGLCVLIVLVLCGVVVSLDSRAQRAAAFPYLLAARSTVDSSQVVVMPATSRELVLAAPKRAVLVVIGGGGVDTICTLAGVASTA